MEAGQSLRGGVWWWRGLRWFHGRQAKVCSEWFPQNVTKELEVVYLMVAADWQIRLGFKCWAARLWPPTLLQGGGETPKRHHGNKKTASVQMQVVRIWRFPQMILKVEGGYVSMTPRIQLTKEENAINYASLFLKSALAALTWDSCLCLRISTHYKIIISLQVHHEDMEGY